MTRIPLRPDRIVAFALIAVAVSQVLFMVLSGALASFSAQAMWTLEAWLYLTMAVAALVLATRAGPGQAAAAAICVGALCNVIQLVIGLTMFGPLGAAGTPAAPVYDAVHAAAFGFYFAGKALFGAAAVMLGLALLARASMARLAGGLVALAGLAALAVNGVAIGIGESLTLPAGASGTIAALAAGLALTAATHGRGAG